MTNLEVSLQHILNAVDDIADAMPNDMPHLQYAISLRLEEVRSAVHRIRLVSMTKDSKG